jgi:hypothetical protein
MRLDEAGAALTDQEGLEDTVAAHGGEIVGEQQRPGRITNITIKGDKDRRLAGHGARAYCQARRVQV